MGAETVTVPTWKLRRAAEILDRDGDEHGVAADLWSMLADQEPTAPLHAEIKRLRKAIEFAAHKLEGGRVWGGMAWSMSPLHPALYQPALERLRAALGPNVEVSG